MKSEATYAVLLGDRRVGTLLQRGDYTRFNFVETYLADPQRPVLGLRFEQNLTESHAASLRLPPWFSNLLPEGVQRRWIANDRSVSSDREMELLAQVGHDLPGAVRVVPVDESTDGQTWDPPPAPRPAVPGDGWNKMKFSLAGVTLKFSMVATGERLTLPAFGEGGDWIVKLPDSRYPDVPANEYTMMTLAGRSGLTVPTVRLVHRDQVDGLPDQLWPSGEACAYAVRRFDRDEHRGLVHIEDLAQVRNVYPTTKYQGNFETVAALIYRQRDLHALQEFTRRLAFNILISNGDAHLKNWSLIYPDTRIPTLAPAYDLVSTSPYLEHEDLGLKFRGSRRFDAVNLNSFTRLERLLGAGNAELAAQVVDLIEQVRRHWPEVSTALDGNPQLRAGVSASIERHARTLLSSR